MKIINKVSEPEFTFKVLKHIDKMHKRWIDFAAYHAKRTRANIDVYRLLEEVTSELISQGTNKLMRLINTPVEDRTELDIWVLRQIKKRVLSHVD